MSSRIDSDVPAEVIIQQLQQECKEWESKFRAEKDEVFRLSGASSKQGRELKKMRTEFEQQKANHSSLEARVAQAAAKEIAYKETISKLQSSMDDDEDTAEDKAELESLRAQRNHMRQGTRQIKDKVVDAEAKGATAHHLAATNTSIQEQDVTAQLQLADAKREAREKQDQVNQLQQSISTYRADAGKVQIRITELEREILSLKSDHATSTVKEPLASNSGSLCAIDKALKLPQSQAQSSSGRSNVSVAQTLAAEPQAQQPLKSVRAMSKEPVSASPVSLGISHVQSVSTEPILPEGDVKPNVNITINLNRRDQSKWNLLQRAQSAISKTSKLNITGPQDVVAEFVAGMNRVVTKHAEQVAATEHWEKIALQSLAEVNSMRSELSNRTPCHVAAHGNLAEQLEAQDVQLKEHMAISTNLQQKMDQSKFKASSS